MEMTMYRNLLPTDRGDSIKKLKSSLTLDLTLAPKKAAPLAFDDILSSPDVRMLKLATPELDRLLLQHQMTNSGSGGGGGGGRCGGGGDGVGGALAATQIWFPRSVTEEQEAYARGFVDALLELHNKRETATAAAAAAAGAGGATTAVPGAEKSWSSPSKDKRFGILSPGFDASLDLSVATPTGNGSSRVTGRDGQVDQLPPDAVLMSTAFCDSSSSSSSNKRHRTEPAKMTSQDSNRNWSQVPTSAAGHVHPTKPAKQPRIAGSTVLDYTGTPPWPTAPPALTALPRLGLGLLSDTPPISPIDMAQQEAIKLARKRARNRLAATRCRNRKLERIARLQERVDELKEQNTQLTNTAVELREVISRMRQEINAHVNNGCRILTSATQLQLHSLV